MATSQTTTDPSGEPSSSRSPDSDDKSAAPREPAEGAAPRSGAWRSLRPLLLRLHFYAGILIGPFLLVAAVTGLLYTATPQLEQVLYEHELQVTPQGAPDALADQVAAAKKAVPNGSLVSVSPPPGREDSTRVVFDVPGLPEGYNTTAFVNPYDHKVLGTLRTYGEWLPARAWLDSLHRTLHLGDLGRNYSELAASWLWVEVLGGLALWLGAPRTRQRGRGTVRPRNRPAGRGRVKSWHGAVGMWASIGLLGLSATGLTWSAHAGANIGELQEALKGGTPTVSTAVSSAGAGKTTHSSSDSSRDVGIDAVVRSAHEAGLSGLLEVTPPAEPGAAYTVKENTRSWPEKQDSVAVDPATGRVTDTLRFADYPVLAKLTRWGIDAHMGLLFGLANQIALALLAVALIAMVLWGYRMWWLRRPTRDGASGLGRAPARGAWRRLPGRVLTPAVVVIAVLGYYVPLLGLPLVVFLAVDVVAGAVRRRRAGAAR